MFTGFSDHGNWLRMYNKIVNNCVVCDVEVDMGEPIYWNRKRSIMHEACYDKQEKLTKALRDDVLNTLLDDPSKARDELIRTMGENISQYEIHFQIMLLMRATDFDTASRLIESALTANSLTDTKDPLLYVQSAIAKSVRSMQEAENDLDTALKKFDEVEQEHGGVDYDSKMLEIFSILIMPVHGAFDSKKARRLAEILLRADPHNLDAALTKADLSADKDAYEIYNDLLSHSGSILRRFRAAQAKQDRLIKSGKEPREKALENAKKFASPNDPQLFLWYLENFYLPDSEIEYKLDADELVGFDKNAFESRPWLTTSMLQELRNKGDDLVKPYPTETDWADLFNRILLLLAQQFSGQFTSAIDSLDNYLRTYGPDVFDELIGFDRGSATTKFDESFVYRAYFLPAHILVISQVDIKKAIRFYEVAMYKFNEPHNPRLFMDRFLTSMDDGISKGIENGILDETEKEKFYGLVLEHHKNNPFALKKLGKEALAVSEKHASSIAQNIAVPESLVKDESGNIEWKKSWYLEDTEKLELANCNLEYVKKLQENGKTVTDRQRRVSSLPSDQRKKVSKEVEGCMRLNITKTICAFLNSDGGKLYFGVKENKVQQAYLVGVDNDVRNAGSKDALRLQIQQKVSEMLGNKPVNLWEAGEGGYAKLVYEVREGKELLVLTIRKIEDDSHWPIMIRQKRAKYTHEWTYATEDETGTEQVAMQRSGSSNLSFNANRLYELIEWRDAKFKK